MFLVDLKADLAAPKRCPALRTTSLILSISLLAPNNSADTFASALLAIISGSGMICLDVAAIFMASSRADTSASLLAISSRRSWRSILRRLLASMPAAITPRSAVLEKTGVGAASIATMGAGFGAVAIMGAGLGAATIAIGGTA